MKKVLKKIIAFICVVTIISSSTFSNVYITEAQGASFWQIFANFFMRKFVKSPTPKRKEESSWVILQS